MDEIEALDEGDTINLDDDSEETDETDEADEADEAEEMDEADGTGDDSDELLLALRDGRHLDAMPPGAIDSTAAMQYASFECFIVRYRI